VTSFGPKPNAQGLRSGISPVAEETAQTIMSHGLPPAQGWRKQQTPQGNFWRFDDWSDLFAKPGPTLPLAPAARKRRRHDREEHDFSLELPWHLGWQRE
jgi:hypothetical protein